MLRINEAAVRLGVTPTTLRRWEAEGRIHPVRTAGGERRYEESEIERLSGRPARNPVKRQRISARDDEAHDPSRAMEPLDYPAADEFPHWKNPPVRTPWDDKVNEAQAGLRVRRIELERANLDREAKEADERQRQRARDATRAAEEQQERARAMAAEKQRLDALRQHGDMLAAIAQAPVEYRAKVTHDLTSYINAAQFPESAAAHAHAYVKARVERILKPWREGEREADLQAVRDREDATRQQQRKDLIQAGLSYADAETRWWEKVDRSAATQDVREALRDDVEDDWTRDEVVALVDEILDEFED